MKLKIEVTSEVADRLEQLRKELGVESIAEVVSRAFVLFDYAVNVRKSGLIVSVCNRRGTPLVDIDAKGEDISLEFRKE